MISHCYCYVDRGEVKTLLSLSFIHFQLYINFMHFSYRQKQISFLIKLILIFQI
jgi:hypothetical protein